MRFAGGLAFVRYGGVSVIARCRSGDIRLYIILKRHDDRLTKKLYWRGESSEGKRAHILKYFFNLFLRYFTASPRRCRTECL